MRTTYNLTIAGPNDENFQNALKTLGVIADFRVTNNGATTEDSFVQYMVDLSKYEFLYLRLAATIGHVIDVDEWERANSRNAHIGDATTGI